MTLFVKFSENIDRRHLIRSYQVSDKATSVASVHLDEIQAAMKDWRSPRGGRISLRCSGRRNHTIW